MKVEDLKVGQLVYDRWYPEWGNGVVGRILATRVHINFDKCDKDKIVYDKQLVQFLEEV